MVILWVYTPCNSGGVNRRFGELTVSIFRMKCAVLKVDLDVGAGSKKSRDT